MDCSMFKQEMAVLFDGICKEPLASELRAHMHACPDCKADFLEMREVIDHLQIRHMPSTPVSLKQNVINNLSKEDEMMRRKLKQMALLNSKIKKGVAVAAILVAIMLVFPLFRIGAGSAKADSLLESSIKATESVKSMVIRLKVRTIAHDNFALVDTKYDMVDHTISKSFEAPEKWRVDKGDRVAFCDGMNDYLWIKTVNAGYKAGLNAGFVEWFRLLLNPESILMKEQQGINDKGAKVTVKEKAGLIYLTIRSKAQGNFINDYCKNRSIQESDNRREYVFDAKTKLLKGLKIYILEGKQETLILETESIAYNVPIIPSLYDASAFEGVTFEDINKLKDVKSETFSSISSKRAAEIVFEGMARNDWASIQVPMSQYNPELAVIKKQFAGLKVIKVGEPFKSGLYPGEFVPYHIILKDGSVRKHKLALRNDNKNKVWLVDGGL